MKSVRILIIVALGVSLSGASAFAGQRGINKRQERQQHRIAEGIESGSLTPKEAVRLEKQEARINALEAKDRKTGGGLSRKERSQLDRLLNSESHRIYKQKHDGQGK
jgi:hypothetical protein